MKLTEAIEIATQLERTLAPTMAAPGTDALKLLIEAGKRVLNSRVEPRFSSIDPLPGETEQ